MTPDGADTGRRDEAPTRGTDTGRRRVGHVASEYARRMPTRGRPFGLPLHVHIATLFVALVTCVGAGVAWLGYTTSRQVLEEAAAGLVDRIGTETALEVERVVAPLALAAELLSVDPIQDATTLEARLERLAPFARTLSATPNAAAVFVGYDDGDFLLLRRLASAADRLRFDAPPGASFLVQSIERRAAVPGRFLALDDDLLVLRDVVRDGYADEYDPRTRTWFDAALDATGAIRTDPYAFFTDQRIGLTVAAAAPNGRAVVGIDLTLARLGASLERQRVTPGSELALLDARDGVIAHVGALAGGTQIGGTAGVALRSVAAPTGAASDAERAGALASIELPTLGALPDGPLPLLAGALPAAGAQRAVTERRSLLGRAWFVRVHPVEVAGGGAWRVVTVIPERELFASALSLRTTSTLLTVAVLVLSVVATWLLARVIAGPLQSLAREADAMRRFRFDGRIGVRTVVREVADLAATMDALKTTVRRFMEVSEAVASERDFDRLLPMLLGSVLEVGGAHRGALLVGNEDGLTPMAIADATGARRLDADDVAPVPPERFGAAIAAAVQGRVPVEGPADAITLPGHHDAVDALPTRGRAYAVPLVTRRGELSGVAVVLTDGHVDDARAAFLQALSAPSATALETRGLIDTQHRLFQSFVRLIADAIDAKSPFTGGHCARVPELTSMLAAAACAERTGPFANFDLDELQWEALHVGAWLHDCGKVTTPDHVIDKATKLETMHDRIHEVRTRFEVLKRDAVIRSLEARLAGTDDAVAARELAREHATLDDEFAFVARCNDGSEPMTGAAVERLHRIAARTWWRTLDDRLGLSLHELERRGVADALPAQEHLLADKPAHRVPREERTASAGADVGPLAPHWRPPPLRFDRGELHNLGIRRGTLTEEERYTINEHVLHTIRMLGELPFPRHLSSVVEIAGGHHERVDGRGYPRGLRVEDLSLEARMVAIADVFEALTAPDRPYRRGMLLSEALDVLDRMRRDGHVDAALFELFVRSGTYRTYAERFMRPEQIDDVDEARYLSATPASLA